MPLRPRTAPPTVLSRYHQYKADTREFSTWMARAAIHHGYSANEFAPSTEAAEDEPKEQKTRNQLKNAKKRLARKAKNGRSAGSGGSGLDSVEPTPAAVVRGRYEIKMSSFAPIAEYLVERQIQLPIQLILLLRRCINRRTAYSKRFGQSPNSITEQHQHFVEVLEKVESVLVGGCHIVEQSMEPKENARSSATSELPTNLFEYLKLEEATEDETSDIEVPEPPRPHGAPTTDKASFAPEEDAGEVLMLLLHYLEDVHLTRRYLDEVWTDYKDLQVDLMTASIVTNTALELLRKPCEEILARALPLFEDKLAGLLDPLLRLLHTQQCSGSLTVETSFKDVDPCCHQAYDYLLIPTYQNLLAKSYLVGPKADVLHVPIRTAGNGTIDHKSRLGSEDFQTRCNSSGVLLAAGFLEYQHLLDSGGMPDPNQSPLQDVPLKIEPIPGKLFNVYFHDEMAVEVHHFRRTHSVTLFLVITAQIYLDILRTLGHSAAEGHNDLKEGCRRMSSSLIKFGATEATLCSKDQPMSKNGLVVNFIDQLAVWEELDPIAHKGTSSYLQTLLLGLQMEHQDGDEASGLKAHPMACGLILFRLQATFQMLSWWIGDQWGTIPCASQLFAACKRLELEDSAVDEMEWADMDMLVKLHGEEKMCGGKTTSSASTLQSYMDKRNYPSDAQGARLSDPSPVTRLLVSKYIDFDTDLRLMNRADHVDVLLREMATTMPYDAELAQRLYHDSPAHLRSPKQRRAQKSILHLLSTLRTSLNEDTMSFRFDYLTMHCRCLEILRAIRTSLADDFGFVQRRGHSMCDHRLSQLFWEFLKSFNGGPGGVDGMLERRRMLRTAAGVFREQLARKKVSEAELRKLSEWSPGAEAVLGEDFYTFDEEDFVYGDEDVAYWINGLGPEDDEYWEYGLYKD